jgi:hypothetical protein
MKTAIAQPFKQIPIARIVLNPEQPRRIFNQEELQELAQSIRQHNVIQPIVVEICGDDYILHDGEWADMKYGWPHKAYFENIPNPHAGLLEIRASANFLPDDHRKDWIKSSDGHWHEPGTPASEKTYGKFYTVHLMDATPIEKTIIEAHLGLHFTFMDDGKVSWTKLVSY